MFDRIITITLNPSLDTTLWIESFDMVEPVFAKKEFTHPGGKAVNVARVLHSLGVNSRVIGFVGNENADTFIKMLNQEGTKHDLTTVKGKIRENLSIVSPSNEMLKINRQGFSVSDDEFEQLFGKLRYSLSDSKISLLVFAGSLPKNVTPQRFKEKILSIKSDKNKIALDTNLFSEADLREINPFIIKPNSVEICTIAGKKLASINEIKDYAKKLSSFAENVLVSLGADGLVYAGGGKVIHCIPPEVRVISSVGAGDTTLAGFIKSLVEGESAERSVIYATACGTASVLLEGTQAITLEEAQAFVDKIKAV